MTNQLQALATSTYSNAARIKSINCILDVSLSKSKATPTTVKTQAAISSAKTTMLHEAIYKTVIVKTCTVNAALITSCDANVQEGYNIID